MARGVVIAAGLLLLVTLCSGLPFQAAQLKGMFEDYKQKFKRAYASLQEERKRFDCFVENLHHIEIRNRHDTARHGINHFTDLCPEEFRAKYLTGFRPLRGRSAVGTAVAAPILSPEVEAQNPPLIDWRDKGAVGPVKSQGSCGSCWAFSAVAAMEGAWNLKHPPKSKKEFVQLSEEFLVQCSKNTSNAACNGGDMAAAILDVIQAGGIPSESSYPYTSGGGKNGTCSTDPTVLKPVAKFSELRTFYNSSEPALARTLAETGPLFIGVEATIVWQTYIGGVLSWFCGNRDLDHGVNLVGVGKRWSKYYWIIRNSWGPHWGEHGYIHLAYGKNCNGVTKQPGTAVAL